MASEFLLGVGFFGGGGCLFHDLVVSYPDLCRNERLKVQMREPKQT